MPGNTREWLHMMRALAPLAARHPQIFAATMERITRKVKGQIIVLPMDCAGSSRKQPSICASLREVELPQRY